MQQIAHGRTVFIIAHRLSTVRDADRIITIERGRLVEDGTHDELIQDGGRYASCIGCRRASMTSADQNVVRVPTSVRSDGNNDELAFLPAALEIVETPPSPVGRAIGGTIIAVSASRWSGPCFGTVDIVATAPGKIMPSGRTKVIQPLETGVVRAIHVQDGQKVKAGDVLIELDPTMNDAERDHLQERPHRRAARRRAACGGALRWQRSTCRLPSARGRDARADRDAAAIPDRARSPSSGPSSPARPSDGAEGGRARDDAATIAKLEATIPCCRNGSIFASTSSTKHWIES